MDAKRPNQRPQKLDLPGIRNLVFALAVSSTIGFWAIFSRVEAGQFSEGGAPAQTSNEAPLLDEESAMAINLPPIPTLIPALDPSLAAPVTTGGLPERTTIGLALPTPSLSKPNKPGDSPEEAVERTVKQRKSKDNSTSTRSS